MVILKEYSGMTVARLARLMSTGVEMIVKLFFGPCLLLLACTALGQSHPRFQADGPHNEVTISFEDTPVRDAFRQLFANRYSVLVYPEIGGLVTGQYKDLDFEGVVQAICIQVDATYWVHDGMYQIVGKDFRQPRGTFNGFVSPEVTVFLDKIPTAAAFRWVLNTLSDGPVAIDNRLTGTVTASEQFSSPEDAISWLCGEVGARVTISNGRYVVAPVDSSADWRDIQVNLREDHAYIRDALRALFRQINVNYSIAPEVQGVISCDLKGNADEVLWRVLEAEHAYFRTESGVVEILHEPNPPQPQVEASKQPPAPIKPPIDIPMSFHKVFTPPDLNFVNAKVEAVLAKFFTRTAQHYILKDHVPANVTLDLSKLPFDQALNRISRSTGLGVQYTNDVFVFRLPSFRGGFVPPGIVVRGGPDDFIYNMIRPVSNDGWVRSNP